MATDLVPLVAEWRDLGVDELAQSRAEAAVRVVVIRSGPAGVPGGIAVGDKFAEGVIGQFERHFRLGRRLGHDGLAVGSGCSCSGLLCRWRRCSACQLADEQLGRVLGQHGGRIVKLVELLRALLSAHSQQHFLAARVELQKLAHIVHLHSSR